MPDYVDIYVEGSYREKRIHTGRGEKLVTSTRRMTWYYDCGEGKFLFSLKFQFSELSQIKRGGYGSDRGIASWGKRKDLARKSR
jgi:hypothetical protein